MRTTGKTNTPASSSAGPGPTSTMMFAIRILFIFTLSAMAIGGVGFAQPKMAFSMKKPDQFQERKLGSEKSADKKFTLVRRFFQNTYSHYNYYFNANQKLANIIEDARLYQKDDYTDLLPFFPYSLDVTARSKDLDSVIQTATAGILLHDLRNDWIDNLYLALGKSYFLRKDFDSAMMTFQFVNFSFAPKEKGGYDIPIGSNAAEGSNALSISTIEKNSLHKRIFSKPPSRNESFLWMIRTMTEQGNYLDAASLVSTIKNDPFFPERLQLGLAENMSFLYYKLNMWDSAAAFRERSIEMANGMEAKARAWYLTGQLYALAKNNEKAVEAFANCSKIAVDPVMDIYARLNTIRMRKGDDPRIIDQNIADLMALARRDSYRLYRDIIYYAAGLFEMERNGYPAADAYLLKSIANNQNNPRQRSQSFMLLGDARYAHQTYGAAAMPYDSAKTNELKSPDSLRVETRRPGTKAVAEAEAIITLQDSLLKVAAMPETDRIEYVKGINKRLRKERGLKEETAASTGLNSPDVAGGTELFAAIQGSWYFYDASRRANGFNAFRRKWGDRRNSDNWRRSAAQPINATATNRKPSTPIAVAEPGLDELETERYDTADISFDNLYTRLPLSPEKQAKANNRINYALFAKGNALHEKIEDYPEAIKVYEALLARLDTGRLVSQSLFALIHCYTKTGNMAAAEQARKKLKQQFPNATETDIANNSKANAAKLQAKEEAATQQYQKVYDLYLEGSFEEAVRLKKIADSLYGRSYWTPQLMYIEMVYFLQDKQDSLALKNINGILSLFAGHALEPRLKLLKELIPKRAEIENYLTNLQVTRATDNEPVNRDVANVEKPAEILPEKEEADPNEPGKLRSATKNAATNNNKPSATASNKGIPIPKSVKKLQADTTGTAALIASLNPPEPEGLNKPGSMTSAVKSATAGTAAKPKPAGSNAPTNPVAAKQITADTTGTAALIASLNPPEPEGLNKPGSMTSAVKLATAGNAAIPKPAGSKASTNPVAAKKITADTTGTAALIAKTNTRPTDTATIAATPTLTQKETKVDIKQEVIPAAKTVNTDSLVAPKPVTITLPHELGEPVTAQLSTGAPSLYTLNPTATTAVAMVLDNIDPAYVNEAFYSLSNHPLRNNLQATVNVEKLKIKEKLWLVVIRSNDFNTAAKAYQYLQYLKPLAANEIISWLDTRKYRYILIDESNLQRLQQDTNIGAYEQLLQQTYPGKF